MKFLQVILVNLFLLLVLVPLLVVESSSSSSSSDNNLASNITRGSSVSLNDNSAPYWLSLSGNIAFGFYQLPWYPSGYVVGIWFVKSLEQTLVWTANPNDFPLHKPSSILFTDEGKLVLRTDNKDKLLLPHVPEPASYAKMQDDGNFVLYGSDSQIVWESFDYPTDTIFGGQNLRPGIDLISGNYRLSVTQADGFVGIYKKMDFSVRTDPATHSVSTVSRRRDSLSRPVILSLDIAGKLYLASFDDEVVKVFYQDKQKQEITEEGDYIYRATLNSIGRLNLHKERIDGNSSSSILWSSSDKTAITRNDEAPHDARQNRVIIGMGIGVSVLIGVFFLGKLCGTSTVKKDETGGSLELAGRS